MPRLFREDQPVTTRAPLISDHWFREGPVQFDPDWAAKKRAAADTEES